MRRRQIVDFVRNCPEGAEVRAVINYGLFCCQGDGPSHQQIVVGPLRKSGNASWIEEPSDDPEWPRRHWITMTMRTSRDRTKVPGHVIGLVR